MNSMGFNDTSGCQESLFEMMEGEILQGFDTFRFRSCTLEFERSDHARDCSEI